MTNLDCLGGQNNKPSSLRYGRFLWVWWFITHALKNSPSLSIQAILRKAGELGLIPHMRQDRQLKTLIRSFCAIPLLPQNLIERGVRILMAQAHQRGFLPLLNDFLHYYIDTFMTMPFFGSLSVFEQPHRTNNVAESCNKLLRKKTGAHRPRLWHFVGR